MQVVFFFYEQKTVYEVRISDWSSDVCSSDLNPALLTSADGFVLLVHHEDFPEISGKVVMFTQIVDHLPNRHIFEIGRASCRERVCQYVSISEVDVSLQKHNTQVYPHTLTYISNTSHCKYTTF